MFNENDVRRPFDVSTLEEAGIAPTDDPFGTRAGAGRTPRGEDLDRDIRRPTPQPKDIADLIPEAPAEDAVNPSHYRRHPSGIECIEVTRHMNFNAGNAIKYLWRYLDKGDPIENLKKAQWYIDDEIRRLGGKQ